MKKYQSALVQSGRIKDASLHVRLSTEKRLYVVPFVLAYVLWIAIVGYVWMKGQWDELWFVPLVVITFSHLLTLLACQWSVNVDTKITCRQVKTVEEAELVKVIPVEHGGKAALVPIERSSGNGRFFIFQRQKFIFEEDKRCFKKLDYPTDLILSEYVQHAGLNNATERMAYYGANKFEMPIPTFIELFKEHAIAPFFVFQIFCVGLWCLDEYWYYSVFTLIMLVMFESTVVGQRLKNMGEFRAMSLSNIDVKVFRSNEWKDIKSEDLLPGDLVCLEFSNELTTPCDMLLIEGTCIVNEAMISGESTPMLKESLKGSRQSTELDTNQLDLNGTDRCHVLFGGTKILQITGTSSSSPSSSSSSSSSTSSSNCCTCYVLRTGFNTLQGKLVRTMMFTSERMTANNAEAFAFILFLLIFALAAAAYVLYHAWDDASRSRVKLLLEAALIITAVVPPELPMELSLAVNNSLMALSKFAIYCMEPFRIPLAGKIDVCCFDKTGTLTGENLVVQGVAGLSNDHKELIADINKIPNTAVMVIATCHSLFKLDAGNGNNKTDSIVGDPMEKTALDFINWTVVKGDRMVDVKNPKNTATILHRFPFSSALKRMSCITRMNGDAGGESLVTCKGAPEVIEGMLVKVPTWYKATYLNLAHRGARVLALAYKTIPNLNNPKQYSREDAEKSLNFAGFLVFHCPLKEDSKQAIVSLKASKHHVVMITGDNALTAIHTAFDLNMASKPVLLMDFDDVNNKEATITFDIFDPQDIDAKPPVNVFTNDDNVSTKEAAREGSLTISKESLQAYDFAITGDAFEYLHREERKGANSKYSGLLAQIAIYISVFARASPTQKELILTTYKSMDFTTMMCGDGTNDVGALKQAHVGVALLDGRPGDLSKILKQGQAVALRKRQIEMEKARLLVEKRWGSAARGDEEGAQKMQSRIEQLTATLEQEEVPMVRLGDASVAAPFTSKISTIEAVCNLIRQGRCTLVTTMQMYKILALNSLISAYGLSVLHLEGIRYGDFQVTVTGMLLAGCFLFLSKARPIQKLAASRPQPNIFNWYVLMSVLLQFCLHVATLYYVVSNATRWSFRIKVDKNTKFTPGLVNTAVYLLSLLMQVSTFVVNYQGRPFRESLGENKSLRNSLAIVSGIALVAALEWYPEFNEWLQLVPMPPQFRRSLVSAMLIDFGGCLAIEWMCKKFLFNSQSKVSKLYSSNENKKNANEKKDQ